MEYFKTKSEWKFYFELDIVPSFKSYAMLSQMSLFSTKSLLSHIWWIDKYTLIMMKSKMKKLIE